MHKVSASILKASRKVYLKCSGSKRSKKPECEQNPEIVAELIYQSLMDNSPCMIARFGANELATVINYIGVKRGPQSYWSYIRGNELDWWWDENLLHAMHTNAGFFPPTGENIEPFCELMIKEMPIVDILGSWLQEEHFFYNLLCGCQKVELELLNPYFSKSPWTKALKGKKILVVHPFAETIQKQFLKRSLLFKNDILPDLNLKTIKAIQSLAGNKTQFKGWFQALEFMKNKIDKTDYDICLIGCGAYGFPLAAHVKRSGKKAVHLGGSLQLLFGIKGKRWENPNYNPIYNYASLMNEHWVKPNEEETPQLAAQVENACYW